MHHILTKTRSTDNIRTSIQVFKEKWFEKCNHNTAPTLANDFVWKIDGVLMRFILWNNGDSFGEKLFHSLYVL